MRNKLLLGLTMGFLATTAVMAMEPTSDDDASDGDGGGGGGGKLRLPIASVPVAKPEAPGSKADKAKPVASSAAKGLAAPKKEEEEEEEEEEPAPSKSVKAKSKGSDASEGMPMFEDVDPAAVSGDLGHVSGDLGHVSGEDEVDDEEGKGSKGVTPKTILLDPASGDESEAPSSSGRLRLPQPKAPAVDLEAQRAAQAAALELTRLQSEVQRLTLAEQAAARARDVAQDGLAAERVTSQRLGQDILRVTAESKQFQEDARVAGVATREAEQREQALRGQYQELSGRTSWLSSFMVDNIIRDLSKYKAMPEGTTAEQWFGVTLELAARSLIALEVFPPELLPAKMPTQLLNQDMGALRKEVQAYKPKKAKAPAAQLSGSGVGEESGPERKAKPAPQPKPTRQRGQVSSSVSSASPASLEFDEEAQALAASQRHIPSSRRDVPSDSRRDVPSDSRRDVSSDSVPQQQRTRRRVVGGLSGGLGVGASPSSSFVPEQVEPVEGGSGGLSRGRDVRSSQSSSSASPSVLPPQQQPVGQGRDVRSSQSSSSVSSPSVLPPQPVGPGLGAGLGAGSGSGVGSGSAGSSSATRTRVRGQASSVYTGQ